MVTKSIIEGHPVWIDWTFSAFCYCFWPPNTNVSKVWKVPQSNYSLNIFFKPTSKSNGLQPLSLSLCFLQKWRGLSNSFWQTAIIYPIWFYLKVFQNLIGQVGSSKFLLRAWDDTSSEMKQWSGIGTSHQWNYTVLTSVAAFLLCQESEIPGKVLSSSATSNE